MCFCGFLQAADGKGASGEAGLQGPDGPSQRGKPGEFLTQKNPEWIVDTKCIYSGVSPAMCKLF